MNIEQSKDVRFHFLSLLYKATGGNDFKFVEFKTIGVQLGLDEKAAFKVAQYLAEEGLLRFRSSTGSSTITHGGIAEVESSRSNLAGDSSHFAAPRNGSTERKQDQQKRVDGVVPEWNLGFSDAQTAELVEIVRLVRASLGRLNLGAQEGQNMDADIRTIEAQLSSSRARRTILTEALDSMRITLESAAGGASMPILIGKMAALSGATKALEA